MSEQELQKVRVKRLAHVGLWATDVVAQARFYRQVLGLDLRTLNGDELHMEDASVFLALDDESHCLGLFADTRPIATNGRKQAVRTQLHHLSVEVDTNAELAALAARLNRSGINLALEPRDGDAELGDTLWFHEPEGNRIEIAAAPEEFTN